MKGKEYIVQECLRCGQRKLTPYSEGKAMKIAKKRFICSECAYNKCMYYILW
jgi:recombinational DNA repair protein (RecF pathway)